MSMKEKFEILRDEPIDVFVGDPKDIPCVETSDSARLCKRPIVSVHMITYNHEPYIRQAIEGVMMQETDFEFELVIGEDCSTDKTREICFEYQKRYPDKIRVFWCDHNLYRKPHPAGGNCVRNFAYCRGEFIAFCEGDDYWKDPLKLQKQVDVMRSHPNVGFCFTGTEIYYQDTGRIHRWQGEETYPTGEFKGSEFHRLFINGKNGLGPKNEDASILMTNSVMVRTDVYRSLELNEEIFRWRLRLSDCTWWLGFASISDAYYLLDVTAVYRCHAGGISHTNDALQDRMYVDGRIVRLYWARRTNFGVSDNTTLAMLFNSFYSRLPWKTRAEIRHETERLRNIPDFSSFMGKRDVRLILGLLNCRLLPLALVRLAIKLRRAWRKI